MRLYLLLVTSGALVIGEAVAASPDCNKNQDVAAGQTDYVYSPDYPNNYTGGTDCRWEYFTTSNSELILNCSDFNLPQNNNCTEHRFSVSPSGDASMSDAHVYCGTDTFTVQSTNSRMVMTLTAPYFSQGGWFMCSLTATVPTTPTPPTCDCGKRNEARIINGSETGANEFPMMAGLVKLQPCKLNCGTTVIASRYTLTAAHCVLEMNKTRSGVLIGEHDISKCNDTNAKNLLKIDSFIPNPDYDDCTHQNDIAVIRVAEDIIFTLQVGPACLPFRFPTTCVGTVVDVLGWGNIDNNETHPNKLMGTQQDIVNIRRCQEAFEAEVSTTNQLCTYRSGTSTCWHDSGGPVLWTGPGNRSQLVGVVSYQLNCADENPEVKTRVFPYLNWILSVTPDAEYCVPGKQ